MEHGGAGRTSSLWESSDRWTSLYHGTVLWGACAHDPAHRLSIQPTESVWWLRREVGKSMRWVHSDLNLSNTRTQMNCFWNLIFISSLNFSRDVSVYLRFKVEKTLQSIAILPKHSADSAFFFWWSFIIHTVARPESKRPPLCAASVRHHLTDLPRCSSPRCSPHTNASSRDQKERLRIENEKKCQSKEGLNLVHLQIKLSYN